MLGGVTTQRESLLWTLEEISHLVSNSGQPEETLGNIVQLIQRTFDTDVCSVYLLEPDRATLVLAATVGLRPDSVGRVRMRLNEGLAGLVGEQLRPQVVEDATAHPRFKYFSEAGEDPYHSFLGVPLIDKGLLQGVLVVQTIEPRVFAPDAVRMLTMAGTQLASIVSHARTLGQFVAPAHQRLEALARNMWWSWDHDTASLFRAIDPTLWRELDHNPIALLQQISVARLEERASALVSAQPHQLRVPPHAGAPDVDAHLGCPKRGRALGTPGCGRQVYDRLHLMADEQNSAAVGAASRIFARTCLELGVTDSQDLVDREDLGVQVSGDGEGEPDVHARREALHRGVEEPLDPANSTMSSN